LGGWRGAKRPWTRKGAGALFLLEPQQLSVPPVPPQMRGSPAQPGVPSQGAGGPSAPALEVLSEGWACCRSCGSRGGGRNPSRERGGRAGAAGPSVRVPGGSGGVSRGRLPGSGAARARCFPSPTCTVRVL